MLVRMPADPLRVSAFCAYLGSWVVLAGAAVVNSIPKLRAGGASFTLSAPVIAGSLLQAVSAAVITGTLDAGPLHPRRFELFGALLCAPLGALLFVWAIRSAPRSAELRILATGGAYRWVRHPIYLSLFAMLLATGMLASSGIPLAVGVVCYLAGSELRIAHEEAALAREFPEEFPRYQQQTPWRYLPGVR